MFRKIDVFIKWLLKEGLILICFLAIMLIIFYALFNVFNNKYI